MTFVAAGALVVGGLAAATPAEAVTERELVRTQFAFQASGIGTSVRGGALPASSGRTALQVIGCTNIAGIDRENHVAEATVPGLGDVSDLKTRVWTSRSSGVVASHSVHSIGKAVLGRGSGLGTLTLNAIRSEAEAFHGKRGFGTDLSFSLGQIVYRPTDGVAQVLEPPAPGETLLVPGLAEITLGNRYRQDNAEGARATITGLRIEVIPSGTTARVARARVALNRGVDHGLFNGHANATRVSALEGNLTSGPNPYLPVPCQGTDGEVKQNNLADLDLGGQAVVTGLGTSAKADQRRDRAWGWTRSTITQAELGGGQLVLNRIVARANVDRRGNKVIRTAEGTSVGSLLVDGTEQVLPDPGEELVIDGVAEIRTAVVDRTRIGITVTAVRITLLDGSGTEINLGQAQLAIRSAGR